MPANWTPGVPQSGTHLYHYQNTKHLEWLDDVISRHLIYLPTFAQLNDPRDGKPRIAPDTPLERIIDFLHGNFREQNPFATAREAQQMLEWTKQMAAFNGRVWVLQQMSSLLHGMFDESRVYCLSRRWNNLQMWAKYADDHRGYCLDFINEVPLAQARDVVYRDGVMMDMTDREDAHAGWFYLKASEWSNEEEVRLVVPKMAQVGLINGTHMRLHATALRSIILGQRIGRDETKRIVEMATKRVPALPVHALSFDAFTQELVQRRIA